MTEELPDVSASPHTERPVTHIRPPGLRDLLEWSELWRHRELLLFLVWRNIKLRYKQTALGATWAVIQPALLMAVMAIVFGRMGGFDERTDVPYPIFLYCGLLPWTFFAGSVNTAANSVVDAAHVVTKAYFPRMLIPLASVLATALDLLVASSILVVLMLLYGIWPTLSLLWLIPAFVLLALCTGAVGTLLSALNVSYRDFRYVVPFLVQLWMFATPTIYLPVEHDASSPAAVAQGESVAAAEESPGTGSSLDMRKWRSTLLACNPLTGTVAMFRAAILSEPQPWSLISFAAGITAVLCVLSIWYFRRAEASFADVI